MASPQPAGLLRGFAQRQFLLALAGGAPAWALAVWLLAGLPWLIYPKVLLILLCTLAWLGSAVALRARAEFQRQLLGNVIEGIAAGDYSQRLRQDGADDLLGRQLNQLIDRLHQQRQQALAASGLADNVLRHIDVAVFAFDRQQRLQLANPTAQRLLQRGSDQLLGRPAAELGLLPLLQAAESPADSSTLEHVFAGAAGLWQLRHQRYEIAGQPHQLLFVTDLKQVLREQELQAWQRLLRVLSHEVNNSLAPIVSLSNLVAGSLRNEGQPPMSEEQRRDSLEALGLIEDRARHLGDFVQRYAQLARPPAPHRVPFDLLAQLRRLPALLPEAGLTLQIDAGEHGEGQVLPLDDQTAPLPFYGDAALIEQLMINLLKNGIEAGGAPLSLVIQRQPLQLSLLDRGCGLANPANLFVPFYTTKPGGSGIGLVLARQIAEAHQGSLQLLPRRNGPGSEARLCFASAVPAAAEAAVKQ
ncbi:ATP-binding protein [Paucibacter sp. APW11]|uniref:histidine kinase n=1 Tax=Roseateles aquae TaxID=3077235 RepID=A0ABU3P8R4_9BURK|nr:ATP-binding protein [Paucibacter sp. APW11]MDT8998965.1 ATP-binding protein [Paucibacter sp. APW11]